MSRERPRSFDPLEIFGPRPPMLVEDRGGFLLWDPEDVALIRSECHGRVEVTRADGGWRTLRDRPLDLSVSSIILGGQPTYFATEFLAEALRAAGVRCPLIVIAYVDYDPFGWGAATGIKRQLERYGMRVEDVRMLVTPARFTPEERRKLSLPLPSTNAAIRGQVREWMKRTHGVDGRRRGLTADSLSLERMLRALEEELP